MNTSSSSNRSVISSLSNTIERVYASKSFAVLSLTGVVALMAGFRIAVSGDAVGEEMFNVWMLDWAVIWASLAIVFLMLLNPLIEFFSQDLRAHREASMMRELIRMEPAMAQELRAMEIQQQYRDEVAQEDRVSAAQALEGIGASSLKPGKVPARRHSDKVLAA
jgi:hypothetical protein